MPDLPQDILRYLPHRPPFVMIDEIEAEKDGPVRSRFTIRAGNVLVENGSFQEGGLVENMAQTAGAATGILAQESGKAPVLGYIGAVKDLKVFALPREGQTLETEVIFVHQVMHALIVRGSVRCEGQLMATCELKIFLQL
jgi:predicted hotdog family 3-hydroxylacyl-ACP dehydratase